MFLATIIFNIVVIKYAIFFLNHYAALKSVQTVVFCEQMLPANVFIVVIINLFLCTAK